MGRAIEWYNADEKCYYEFHSNMTGYYVQYYPDNSTLPMRTGMLDWSDVDYIKTSLKSAINVWLRCSDGTLKRTVMQKNDTEYKHRNRLEWSGIEKEQLFDWLMQEG